MSSIKLSSSGGGSVSLSAASTSTDVTIKFPSSNSSASQALVASNTSGELNWETVPNSAAVPLLRLAQYTTPLTSDYVGTGVPNRPIEWGFGSSSNNFDTDTHSAWDATNYWYVVPQAGFYRVRQSFHPPTVTFSDTTKTHTTFSWIACAPAVNKGSWTVPQLYYNAFNRRDGDVNSTSISQTEVLRCEVGDAIKTSFLWDKGTDSNNTTTAVEPRVVAQLSTFTTQSLSIEFVRPL